MVRILLVIEEMSISLELIFKLRLVNIAACVCTRNTEKIGIATVHSSFLPTQNSLDAYCRPYCIKDIEQSTIFYTASFGLINFWFFRKVEF